ncbi:hypothetical protein VNO77_15212 [Canavalia gladiata]|uniref:H15 domain-containing protein n=1 Tax=Canavalia gladiata TaxID=3824 RepID=A0AAN9QRA0_CANGL
MEDQKRNLAISRFKDSILFRLRAFNPSFSINSAHSSFIHQRLQHLFHSFKTPTHPPYALMIKRALMELKEENGSSEETISDYIRREYEDLPWAHVRILHIHLGKLCLDGDLAFTDTGRYVLLVNSDHENHQLGLVTSGETDLIVMLYYTAVRVS